jgi:uncharacterized membrane protein
MATKTQAKPLFAATLTPHRSLSPPGKRVVIALVTLLALVPSVLYYAVGAWPVIAFMGLDIIGIVVALTLSRRQGKASEIVTLWPDALELKRIDAKGRETLLGFKPFDVRFVIDRDYNERVTALWLRQRDDRYALGAFLSPEEKLSFAKAFGTALRKARG